VPIAWAVSRTDMPGKSFVRAIILRGLHHAVLSRRHRLDPACRAESGWLNRIWMTLTGSETGFSNIYSFGGLVFITALYSFPYIFVFASGRARPRLDRDGGGRQHPRRRRAAHDLQITLPLVTPAIIGGAIITFLDAVACSARRRSSRCRRASTS